MNALNAAMTVIGAGSYGTALAITPGKKWPPRCAVGP